MKLLKKILASIAALLVVVGLIITVAAYNVTLTMDEITPSGMKRNPSYYITMRDGTRIAVDVWLPADYSGTETYPTLIRATRYGRSYNVRFLYRVFALFGQVGKGANHGLDIKTFNAKDYVVVRVDARGSGASEGVRNVPWSRDEIADYGEVASWITQQKWSNGRLGAYGVSYDGNTAELIAATKHPALKAVAPLYSYYDPYQNLSRPGGVFDDWFVKMWSMAVNGMDTNATCRGTAFRCWYLGLLSDGIKPVDGPDGYKIRDKVYAKRNNPLVYASVENADYRDDPHGDTGVPFDDTVPYARKAEIEASGVAMNPWVGWYDGGTVNGALSRYLSNSNPQQLVIAPLTHGGKHDTDPYADPAKPVSPSMPEQYEMLADFFDPLLKEGVAPESIQSGIRYYTMGEGVWKTTSVWPPKGAVVETHYFARDGALNGVVSDTGTDTHTVNRSETMGKRTRWHTIGGPDVRYDDQASRDEKRLTYTSAPLTADTEITGVPIVHLHMASSTPDCAVFAYLEDVAPDGKVTYLTEGMLRCANRKISDAEPPYTHFGAYHSHVRADSMSMKEGSLEYLTFPLFAISAKVKAGHSIRVAISGHEGAIFRSYPTEEGTPPVFVVARGGVAASAIDLPIIKKQLED